MTHCVSHMTHCVSHMTHCVSHMTHCVSHMTHCVSHMTYCISHMTTYRFVNSYGYVQLFPFLLKLVPPNSEKLGYILTELRNKSVR